MASSQCIPHIPSALAINYNDVDEMCGYQLLLCKMFERAGGLLNPRSSSRGIMSIRKEGKIWLDEVELALDGLFDSPIVVGNEGLTLGDLPRILRAYDIFYRMANGKPCYKILRDTVIKTAGRYAKGDKHISEAQVALMLRAEARRDMFTMDRRYLAFSGQVMKSWIADLERTGRIKNISAKDSYDVLRYLLMDDLFAFGIKENDKLRWVAAYSLPDEKVDALDTNTLWGYIGFEQASESLIGRSLREQDERYIHLFNKLASRPDLHPFFKEGLSIELSIHASA